MKKKLFLLMTLGFLAANCSLGQGRKILENDIKINGGTSTKTAQKKQILLTNYAEFKGSRTLEGASGFLINYDNANYAVTARHLLGEAGGIEPEVNINALDKNLIKWEMSPRIVMNAASETVRLNAKGLDFSKSTHDIVLLNVVSDTFNFEVLTPNFSLPNTGETLYLIGCPYSETGCRQNTYAVRYVKYDAFEGALVCEITSKVEMAGFSGAPLINGKGEVVGVLVSGSESDGKTYIIATHIKEIQKIK